MERVITVASTDWQIITFWRSTVSIIRTVLRLEKKDLNVSFVRVMARGVSLQSQKYGSCITIAYFVCGLYPFGWGGQAFGRPLSLSPEMSI